MNKTASPFFTLLIATMSLIAVVTLWRYNFILTAALLILAVLMLSINKSKQEIKTFIFCAFLGASAEAFAITFNVWNYKNPNFIGIPLWLVLLWGIAAIFIIRLHSFFKN